MNKIVEALNRCMKLSTLVKKHSKNPYNAPLGHQCPADGLIGFDTDADDTQRAKLGCDGAEIWVDPKSGTAFLYTWFESGHNGDHYGTNKDLLLPHVALKKLDEIEKRLTLWAHGAFKQKILDEQSKKYDELATQMLEEELKRS